MRLIQLIRSRADAAYTGTQDLSDDADGVRGEVVMEDGETMERVEVQGTYLLDLDDFLKRRKKKSKK